MKKILIALTIFISIFAFSDIKAQHSFADKVQFGVKAGGNWSSSSLYANDWREFGFNAGFIAEYRINSSFALAVELG
ncbi:MAG: hypothetical protein LBM96_04435, partial [Methanobrevibacter sp.]|nr:hypothetical protein [Candidatus Methanoflexus mossambicus]